MENKPLNYWDIMESYNPELNESIAAWRTRLTNDTTIPRKYKELMMVGMACVVRYIPGIKLHAQYALENGASKDELFAAVAQAMTVGGIPAFREGAIALQEILMEGRR